MLIAGTGPEIHEQTAMFPFPVPQIEALNSGVICLGSLGKQDVRKRRLQSSHTLLNYSQARPAFISVQKRLGLRWAECFLAQLIYNYIQDKTVWSREGNPAGI